MNEHDLEYNRIVMVGCTTIDDANATQFAAIREADLVIVSRTRKVIKDRYGVAGRIASSDECGRAVVVA